MSDVINTALARRAAQLYAGAKWGPVTLDEGTPILGMRDDAPRAYVFLCDLRARTIDLDRIADHLKRHITPFVASSRALRAHSEGTGQLTPEELSRHLGAFRAARSELLAEAEYGTIVIRARADRHPFMLAAAGLPFNRIGVVGVLGIHGARLDANVAPVLRLADGDGYPHFYGDFQEAVGGRRMISLLDLYSPADPPRAPRPPRQDPAARTARYRALWAFIASIKDSYLAQMSPSYILSPPNKGMISGVPDFLWYKGCAPTAAANILGFWDARGYPRLIDDPRANEWALIEQLARAMETDSAGSSKDEDVDDGIEAVCNDACYGNGYGFAVSSPDSWHVWGKLVAEIRAGRPCHLIVHGHECYHDHSVTVVGFRRVEKNCAADDYFVTIHDTWGSTGTDVEIVYEGSVDGCDVDWRVIKVQPGLRRSSGCAAADAARQAAALDQKFLLATLTAERTSGPLATGVRALVREAPLREEFNQILEAHPELLAPFGRQLIAAAQLVRLLADTSATEGAYGEVLAREMKRVLGEVRGHAGPELAGRLEQIMRGIDLIAGQGLAALRAWLRL